MKHTVYNPSYRIRDLAEEFRCSQKSVRNQVRQTRVPIYPLSNVVNSPWYISERGRLKLIEFRVYCHAINFIKDSGMFLESTGN